MSIMGFILGFLIGVFLFRDLLLALICGVALSLCFSVDNHGKEG